MSAEIKICGFTEPESLRAAVALGIDWAGFNFCKTSARYVTPEAAQTLLLGIGDVRPVALLVDADDAQIDEMTALGFPVLQLHGQESPERVAEIKQRTGLEIWKAFGIRAAINLAQACQYKAADRLLLDAKPPENAQNMGGHGVPFDWSLLKDWQREGAAPRSWLLAGGLSPGNVAEAISVTGAPAVDVSSGVEHVRGLKNAGLMRDFVSAVKQA